MDLWKILSETIKQKINTFTTLYRASDHNYDHKVFHELCGGKGPILLIIESSKHPTRHHKNVITIRHFLTQSHCK